MILEKTNSSPPTQRNETAGNDKYLHELTWHMVSINNYLEDIRRIWAEILGVSGPQWLILMSIADSRDQKTSVGDVAAKLHVTSTFVTAQTKRLENAGLLMRYTSPNDARIVLMSLTDKAREEIEKLSARRKALQESVLVGMSEQTLSDTQDILATISRRIEKASLQLQLDHA